MPEMVVPGEVRGGGCGRPVLPPSRLYCRFSCCGNVVLDCDEDVFSVAVQLIDAVPLLRMLTLKVCASVATREFATGMTW